MSAADDSDSDSGKSDRHVAVPDRLCYAVDHFCAAAGISRASFYELVNAGEGPRLMRVGRRTLVSVKAAAEWIAAREESYSPGRSPRHALVRVPARAAGA